jgi:hypothetical protein
MIIYISSCVFALWYWGIWRQDNLKTTIYWAVGFAFLTLFDLTKIDEVKSLFKEIVRDAVGVAALIVFVSEFHMFSLAVEILLVPILFLLSAAIAMGKDRPGMAHSVAVATTTLAIIGFVMLAHSAYLVWTNPPSFFDSSTLRDYASPILLTLLFLPFAYFIHAYSSFESAFVRVGRLIEDPSLVKFAKRRSIRAFTFDLAGLKKWMRDIAHFRPSSEREVTDSIQAIKHVRRREMRPYVVPPTFGWPPERARAMLAEVSLFPGDYHRAYDGWRTNSGHIRVGDQFGSSISFHLEGTEFQVTKMTLTLSVFDSNQSTSLEARFVEVSTLLLQAALRSTRDALEISVVENAASVEVHGRFVQLIREPSTAEKTFTLELSISDERVQA